MIQAESPPLQKPPSQVSSSAGWGSTTPAAGVLSQADGSDFCFLELWITLKDSYWWKSEACGQAGTSLGFPKFPPSFCCSWLLPSCFLSHRCLCLFPLSLLWNWCTYPDLQTWCFSFVISTEGALRLPTTYRVLFFTVPPWKWLSASPIGKSQNCSSPKND